MFYTSEAAVEHASRVPILRKNGNPRTWSCAREGKKHSSSLPFERTSSLSAGQSILNLSTALVTTSTSSSWARDWGGDSSVSLVLALTTSNSSESDNRSVCGSIGAEETTARASQPWGEALNLSGEGRDKAVLISASADRSLCEPQDCSLRCASSTAGPEPWGMRSPGALAKERQARSRSQGKHIAVTFHSS